MLIKPLCEYRHFDVFLGSGWRNWVRVKYDKNRVSVVKTEIETLGPNTLKVIYYKIKHFIEIQERVQDE